MDKHSYFFYYLSDAFPVFQGDTFVQNKFAVISAVSVSGSSTRAQDTQQYAEMKAEN